MDNEQIIEQIESWIMAGKLSFDDLQLLTEQAYAKEAADDVRYGNE